MKLNKGMILSAFLLIALLLVPLVSAQLTVTTIYDKDTPTFGDSKTKVSNPEHDSPGSKIVKVESTIEIKNDYADSFSVIGINSLTGAKHGLTKSDFSIITGIGLSISGNGLLGSLKIEAKLPESLDAVDTTKTPYEEVAFSVGNLIIDFKNDSNTSQIIQVPFEVFMQRGNELTIDDVDALINDKDTTNNIDDGDDIKDLRPGDKVELTIKVQNGFSSKDNLDIENIEVDISCDEENDLDFDEDNIDFGDLGPNDDDTDTLFFDIEEDASDNTITCTLTAEGTDQNGAVHAQSMEFDLVIDRKSHDIVIKDVRLNPTALSCDDNSFQVAVDFINLGTRDEDQAAIQIQSLALSINQKISNLQLDEDDSVTETFVVPVDPNAIKEGVYAILVSGFYDNTKQTDSRVVQINNVCEIANTDKDDTGDSDGGLVGFFTNAMSLSESEITAQIGKLISIKVTLTNEESFPVDYTVNLDNINEFATSTSSKTVHLNPGQTSSVFLNMKIKDDVVKGASYTGNIALREAGSTSILETETFTVNIEEATKEPLFGNLDLGGDSKILLTIGNIVLVIIAIFLIKLIFTSGTKKKPSEKKLADYDTRGGSVVIKGKK